MELPPGQSSTSADLVAQWSTLVRNRQTTVSVAASSTLAFAGGVPVLRFGAPEIMAGAAFVDSTVKTSEGQLIAAVTPLWWRFFTELAKDPNAFMQLDPWQMEELIAGAYSQKGWTVTLTPRSGDKGRDIIATRSDVGAIRILDQVKRYKPGHVVEAGEVRALFGVLSRDQSASKAVLTTTSRFAPGVYSEFASAMPTRLDLRDGQSLREWLNEFVGK